MKNEKLILKRPWPNDIPEFAEENAVEDKNTSMSWYNPRFPVCFFTSTFDIKNETYLEIVFYVGKQLKYRMFFLNRDYIGQNAADLKGSTAGIEYLEQYQILERWYRGSKESSDAIYKYFKIMDHGKGPIQRVSEMITQEKKRKLKESHDKIRKSVDDVMLQIKPIPKDFENWVENGPLKKSKYIFYQYAKRVCMKGVCSECHQDVIVIRPKNDQPGVCPNCKAKVTYKAAGIARNIVDQTYVSLVQKIKDGYVIRYFYAKKYYFSCTETLSGIWSDISGSYRNPIFKLYERAREFEADYRNYYVWEEFKNTGEHRFCQENSMYSGNSYLYGRNCKAVFSDEHSNRKYFPFSDFCNHAPQLNVAEFLKDIIRIPQLEYLAKAKLYRLTAEMSNGSRYDKKIKQILGAKKLWEGLGIAKDYLPIVQKENMDMSQIALFAATIRFGKDQAILAKRWVEKESSRYWDTDQFLDILEYTSPVKGIKYLESQRHLIKKEKRRYGAFRYGNMHDIQVEWIDYLENADKLGYDLKNSFVLFPAHLPEAHDEMSNQRMALEEKIKEAKYTEIKKIASELNHTYGMKSKTFFIRAPRDYKELTQEGQNLHHCVGTYAMRHATKATTILFIRRIEDPETSFYTLEYQRGNIVQVRGMRNCSTTPEVQAFVNAWEKKIKQNAEKQKLQLAIVAG